MEKYIITDPCYLMHINANEDENHSVWREFCNLWFADKFDDAEALLKDYLKLDYLTICDTGYGDWVNHLYTDSEIKIYEQEFSADAGLVCVANCTDEIFKNDDISGAVFETEQLKDVRFNDDDPDWTVVEIRTKEGSLHTEYPDTEDEDSEGDDWPYWDDYWDEQDFEDNNDFEDSED